ncbi:hypothetical protein AbraCBS73388_005025 [Aspergillus brasiliensis]|uniref:Glycosyl hydrolase family 32 N-terminal domain-containing protein n=1 Tax=Aspergillus brasiliensis TaxID=319629 RepID=A0A9W6DLR5_9EURO|nr:hypothetical protein AbraCBS73388_005025 [Aspergillus brasiliensis]
MLAYRLSLALFACIPFTTSQATRPSHHITSETKWTNDPQRAFFLDNAWHLSYLYNTDFNISNNPESSGTSWYHVTSTDMVHWTHHGVANHHKIPTQSAPTASSWVTSKLAGAVVDAENTADLWRQGKHCVLNRKWDGKAFTAADAEPQLMDKRPDFYATVSWNVPKDDDIYDSRYAIVWMNNWEYANSVPYYGDFAGQTSMVREVKLQTIKDTPTLVSKPIVGYGGIFDSAKCVSNKTITTDPESASLPSDLTDDAYVICATISKTNDSGDGNEVRFRTKTDGSFSTTIGVELRDSDGSATESMPSEKAYAVATAPNPSGSNTVKLEIYVDSNSVEVFVDDGVAVLSGLDYPNKAAKGVQVVSDTGSLTLVSFSYAAYKA